MLVVTLNDPLQAHSTSSMSMSRTTEYKGWKLVKDIHDGWIEYANGEWRKVEDWIRCERKYP